MTNPKQDYISLEEAFSWLKNGDTVVTAMACAEPQRFFQNAGPHIKQLEQIKLYCANPTQPYEMFQDDSFQKHIELRTMFLTASVRDLQDKSHVQYIPQHLSQWASNILSQGEVDLFWGSCSLPDERGFVSLGPANCYEYDMLRRAKKVVLEANPNIPFTHGTTCIPLGMIDGLVQSQAKLPTYKFPEPDETDRKIASYVAEIVPDEATIQLGIGSIPNALVLALKNKKNLGIHTEMINDAILDLFRLGVVTGQAKSIWPNKIIGAFAYGSQDLYNFLDQNPLVELHSASIVNDPYRIGRNHKMTSINTAVEVDITGQVCSESIGHLELSGVGGATDTHVGAQRSEGGRGIIALKSMTKKGLSKIVPELKPGAKVSISRNDVDTIITEFGIAQLKGQTVSQRSERLIAISHPSVREELRSKAKQFGYL